MVRTEPEDIPGAVETPAEPAEMHGDASADACQGTHRRLPPLDYGLQLRQVAQVFRSHSLRA